MTLCIMLFLSLMKTKFLMILVGLSILSSFSFEACGENWSSYRQSGTGEGGLGFTGNPEDCDGVLAQAYDGDRGVSPAYEGSPNRRAGKIPRGVSGDRLESYELNPNADQVSPAFDGEGPGI